MTKKISKTSNFVIEDVTDSQINKKDTFYIISIKEYEALKEKSMLKTLARWNTFIYDSSIGECKLYKLNKETYKLELFCIDKEEK